MSRMISRIVTMSDPNAIDPNDIVEARKND